MRAARELFSPRWSTTVRALGEGWMSLHRVRDDDELLKRTFVTVGQPTVLSLLRNFLYEDILTWTANETPTWPTCCIESQYISRTTWTTVTLTVAIIGLALRGRCRVNAIIALKTGNDYRCVEKTKNFTEWTCTSVRLINHEICRCVRNDYILGSVRTPTRRLEHNFWQN